MKTVKRYFKFLDLLAIHVKSNASYKNLRAVSKNTVALWTYPVEPQSYDQGKHPFEEFGFAGSGFQIFKETTPQLLVVKDGGGLKWDRDEIEVSSWQILIGRSYAQLRNNVAHGNKAQLTAPFTHDQTREFLEAGHQLIHFIAGAHSPDETWNYAIQFY